MSKAHPGFQAVQSKIAAKEGISQAAAGAILAKSSRDASPAAKRANPRLDKVSGARQHHSGQDHPGLHRALERHRGIVRRKGA